MTQQSNQVDTAVKQSESAAATVKNIEREAELNKLPFAQKAKMFQAVQPGASMSMLTTTGRTVIFRAGKCITKDPVEIEYLISEIRAGNPMLLQDVQEVEDEKTMEELLQAAREEAVANYIAQTKGATASGGTSDNSGGVMGTTQNMTTAAQNAPQTALDALKAKAAATPSPEQVEEVEKIEAVKQEDTATDATADTAKPGVTLTTPKKP